MCTSIAVANYFKEKAKEDNTEMSLMKLIKLTYIAHGWHLSLYNGKPLFDDEVQAWKYGPVIPKIYDKFKGHDFCSSLINRISPKEHLTDERKKLLDAVWNKYKQFSGVDLSAMTHKEGTPWFYAWYVYGGQYKQGAKIENELIKSHYDKIRSARSK